MEIEQNNSGFLVAVAVAPDRGEAGEGCADQLAAVARRHRQPHRLRRIVLCLTGLEAIGFDKDHETRHSVDLVATAGQCGHEARHVAHVGRAGWKDWNVTRYASDNDLILVTNNASDFRQLYAAEPLHAGLVILLPNVGRDLQQRLFRAAVEKLAVIGEAVNRVLEVDLDGDEVTLTLYDLPPDTP